MFSLRSNACSALPRAAASLALAGALLRLGGGFALALLGEAGIGGRLPVAS